MAVFVPKVRKMAESVPIKSTYTPAYSSPSEKERKQFSLVKFLDSDIIPALPLARLLFQNAYYMYIPNISGLHNTEAKHNKVII